MLRLLIGLGSLLMVVGFGAAGWQYWQTLSATASSAAPANVPDVTPARAPELQRWLLSPAGALVPQTDVRAFLVQDRFVSSRTIEVIRRASLGDLLDEGEKLPVAAYHEVLADIRAPRVAKGLCEVLIQTFAADCALNSARVVEGSVDELAGTAMFRLELVYRVKADATDLPDLAAHVLRSETVELGLLPGEPGTESPDAALATVAAAVSAACADQDARPFCRPLRLWLDWRPDRSLVGRAEVAWLDPLPEGMYVAPPLEPATGG